MKASIKFREEEKPLLRAKVPIGVLGLPFQTGLSAGGDPKELRFDLSTAFSAGPALRLSYRPNDAALPFALSVRTGLGPLGSPSHAPFSISAEFNLLATPSHPASTPAFSLLFKPRLGDFALKNSVRSAAAAAAPKVNGDANGDDPELVGLRPFVNGAGDHKSFSFAATGFTANVAAAAAAGRNGGIGALLSGMQLTTRSVLPLWNRASMRFQWGLRVPPELRGALGGSDGFKSSSKGSVSIPKLPVLVMNKISIEQLRGEDGKGKKKGTAATSADAAASEAGERTEDFSLVKRQLEALNAESGMLRRAVEDLRTEIGSSRGGGAIAGGEVIGRSDVGRRVQMQQQQPPPPFPMKADRRGSGKESPESGGKMSSDEVSEELKKALDARRK